MQMNRDLEIRLLEMHEWCDRKGYTTDANVEKLMKGRSAWSYDDDNIRLEDNL